MPIYEFKCLKCNDIFELLVRGTDDSLEMRCPKCASEDFERVMSSTRHFIGAASAGSSGPRAESRQCKSGNCTTYEIPGP